MVARRELSSVRRARAAKPSNGAAAIILVLNGRIPGPRAHSIAVARTADALQRLGRAVEIWAPRRQGRCAGEPRGRGEIRAWYGIESELTVRYLPCVDLVDVLPRPLQRATAVLLQRSFAGALARALRPERGEAIFIVRDPGLWSLFARGPHPWVAEVHELPRRAPARRRALGVLERARAVLAISDCARETLRSEGLRHPGLGVLPSAAPAAWLKAAPQRAQARRELGIDPAAQVICYAGHLYRWKGCERLAAAAAQLGGVQVRVVGGLPADRRRLARGLRTSNVHLCGFLPPALVARELRAADVALATLDPASEKARTFTSPLKVFEALALGVPLVAPDLPPLREILAGSGAALLHASADPREPARSLARVLGDPGLGARLVARGRELVQGHTYEARAERLAAVCT